MKKLLLIKLGLVIIGAIISASVRGVVGGVGAVIGGIGLIWLVKPIISGILDFLGGRSSDSSSSSSSRGSSVNANAYTESRKNGPHTCGNCKKYSSTYGKCKLSDTSKSAEDSCSNWC